MEDAKTPRTWVTYSVSALVSLLLIEPALWLIEHNDHGLPYEDSHWYELLLIISFVVIPYGIGVIASKRHTDYPLRSSALATICASGVIVVFAIARTLVHGHSITFENFIKYAVYLQFTIALSIIAAYVALRTRVLKETARIQQSAATSN